jgi:hypothetical protein
VQDDPEGPWPRWRAQAAQRLYDMNIRQAVHAWDLRYSDPLGPHGLAFLYADGAGVHAATRLWPDDPDTQPLPYLLKVLADSVALGPACDPRRDLADRDADGIHHGAQYIGVGVSSLDTPARSWQQTQVHADGLMDVAGRCYAYLDDATMLLIDRGGRRDLDRVQIRATRPLRGLTYPLSDGYRLDPHLTADTPATHDVWVWLRTLHARVGGSR